MAQGLSVSRLVRVSVNLSPLAAAFANFDSLCIIGDTTGVIDTAERMRSYNTLDEVIADFGTTAPEYLAADLFFSQKPQPAQLYIGRWAQGATHGTLHGGGFSVTQQAALLATLQAINAAGSIRLTVDGVVHNLAGLDFHLITNLNGAASVLNTAAAAFASCTWDAVRGRFDVRSNTTGAASTVAYAAATGSGTDVSATLNLTQATGASAPVAGIVAETALTALTLLDGLAQSFYGVMFASVNIVDADHLAIAAYIEGSGNPHIYGLTTSEAAALMTSDTTSIGHQLRLLGYDRSAYQFSSSSPYAIASYFGRAFTVDFNANNSTITMMWKQEPGIVPEALTPSQADALEANNYNYFAPFNNNTQIIVGGKMASGVYFDEIHGTDWMADNVRTRCFNALYTSPTKIPQTDAGNHILVNQCEAAGDAAVNNGLLAPGVWDQAGFGQIKQGDFLTKGYYVFAPPIASQAASDRAARKSVPIQMAVKLAGAIHTVDVIINVNR